MFSAGPNIKQCLSLVVYKEREKRCTFNLKEKTSTQWRETGLLLGMELNQLDEIEHKAQQSATECWEKVMQKWLDGQGADSYPVCWGGLYNILDDLKMTQVAIELRNAVEKFHTL